MSAGGESRGLKVVDRRWFTEDGRLREDRKPTSEPTHQSTAGSQLDAKERESGPGSGDPEPSKQTSRSFLELVGVLAQQAELLMAGAPGVPRQMDQGLRLIEYLATLEDKTRGNLSVEESQILSNTLFQLRALGARAAR